MESFDEEKHSVYDSLADIQGGDNDLRYWQLWDECQELGLDPLIYLSV